MKKFKNLLTFFIALCGNVILASDNNANSKDKKNYEREAKKLHDEYLQIKKPSEDTKIAFLLRKEELDKKYRENK